MTTYAQHPDSTRPNEVNPDTYFAADLFSLFRAGKAYMPETANRFAESARAAHQLTPILDSLATTSGERAMRQLSALRENVHFALNRTAMNMNATGEALVDTAKEYARSDDAVLAEFRRLCDDPTSNEDLQDPPSYDPPPAPGDAPESSSYGRPGRA